MNVLKKIKSNLKKFLPKGHARGRRRRHHKR